VLFSNFFLATWLVVGGPVPGRDGVIIGTVVNTSRGKTPEGGSEVVLGIRLGTQFVPYDQTKADSQGRFRFERLPVGNSYSYRAGASRDGVHYPGPALELTALRPLVFVELPVCDTVADPCPLVIRRQEVFLRHEPGVLSVTESILIDNPSTVSYVGKAAEEGGEPVTLQLAIPSDFTRATFDEEFYGRRFSVAGGKLVTGIPWPPGKRRLKLSYTLPSQSRYHRWERPLDLPCDALRVRVEHAAPDEVVSNLKRGTDEAPGTITFDADGSALPAGHTVSVELGRLPVPLMVYARWVALAILVTLVCGATLTRIRRRRKKADAASQTPETSATAGGKRSRRNPNPSSSRRAA
jgi:hypothetical protein